MNDRLPLVRSVKSCIVGTLLIALPFLFFILPGQRELLGPLPALYAALLILFLLPTALCLATMVCGTLAAALGLAAALASITVLTGTGGLLLTAVYVLPVLAAFYIIIAYQIPFRKSCPVMIGVHVAALAAVYALAQRMAGGDLYTAAGNAVADFLESWEMGDMMLYQLYSTGLIGLKNDVTDNVLLQVLGGYKLSAAAKADMLLSVRSMVRELLESLVPNELVSQSILGGVACLLLPLRFGFLAEERRAFLREGPGELTEDGKQKINFPTLDMPPFSLWHLPRGIGWQVGVALAAGYMLRMTKTPALSIAGSLLFAAASSIFMIQGAAAINFLQKSRGTRRFWRVVVPILLMMIRALVIIGIFDQISNFRGLRKPPEPKEDFE